VVPGLVVPDVVGVPELVVGLLVLVVGLLVLVIPSMIFSSLS
jgi:hypothetical protein